MQRGRDSQEQLPEFPFTYSEIVTAFAQISPPDEAVAQAEDLYAAFEEARRLAPDASDAGRLVFIPEVSPDDMVLALLANLSPALITWATI